MTAAPVRSIARRLRRSRAVVTVRAGPGRGLRIGTSRASADYRSGDNELAVQEAIATALSAGDVFFDIGANVGFFSLIAAREVGPSGLVYAFEPVPQNVDAIVSNRARNHAGNVTVVPCAVGDAAGVSVLYLDEHPGGATTSAADRSAVDHGSIDVEIVRIDDLVESGTCAPPDVVKIDVEGAEDAVIRGMGRTLSVHRPVVVCEVDAADRPRVEAKASAVEAVLGDHGYVVRRLADSYASTAWEVVHLVARPPD